MLRNLKAEMTRKDINAEVIAKTLGVTERTVRNKIDGATGFSFFETLKIREKHFPDLTLEYLFEKTDSPAEDTERAG